MSKRTIEEIHAAYDFRTTLLPRADLDHSGAPMWYGWAIAEAFWAGIEYQKRQ